MLSRMRLSRRRFLAGALAVAGTAAAGCGGDDNEETPPEATGAATGEPGEPKRGGTLRLATTTLLGLDPHTAEGILLAANFYSAVIQATDWQGTVGDLAESWEVVDGLDWTFKVRSDVRFQDIPPVSGRPLVAEDIPRSIDRARSLPGSGEQFGQWLESYAAPDAQTFTLRTKKPYAYLLMLVGSVAIIPIEAVEEFGDLKSHAIGSGPFVLTEYGRGEVLGRARNPNYYHEFPYVDGVTTRVIPEESSIQAAFRANSIDVYQPANKLKAEAVENVRGATTQRYLDRAYTVLRLNGSKFEPFKDERVRGAVDLA